VSISCCLSLRRENRGRPTLRFSCCARSASTLEVKHYLRNTVSRRQLQALVRLYATGLAGIDRLFRHFGRAFKVEMVAIRVRYGGNPQTITDKRPLRGDPTRNEVVVDPQGVDAYEADGDSLAQLALWHSPSVPVAPVLLKHERCVAEFEPTPADASSGVHWLVITNPSPST
jgi:hypothetical protein